MSRRSQPAARGRHPSVAGWRPAPAVLTERLAARYESDGMAHPRVAASLVAARGRTGLSRSEFASSLGIRADDLASAESGEVAAASLPQPLREVAGREQGR